MVGTRMGSMGSIGPMRTCRFSMSLPCCSSATSDSITASISSMVSLFSTSASSSKIAKSDSRMFSSKFISRFSLSASCSSPAELMYSFSFSVIDSEVLMHNAAQTISSKSV